MFVQRVCESCSEKFWCWLKQLKKTTCFKNHTCRAVGWSKWLANVLGDVEFGIVRLTLSYQLWCDDNSVAPVSLNDGAWSCWDACGTTQALALLNNRVKKMCGIMWHMAMAQVGGLSGCYSSSEDDVWLQQFQSGHISLEKGGQSHFDAAICSGWSEWLCHSCWYIDTTIAAMVLDEAAIGVINRKQWQPFVLFLMLRRWHWSRSSSWVCTGNMKVNKSFIGWHFVRVVVKIPSPVHSFKN